MKLCKDCKFESYRMCALTAKRTVDYVTGHVKVDYTNSTPCVDERNSILPWKCGKKARFFELGIVEKSEYSNYQVK